jgi:spore coat polysaccharide biosynthesis protein SpsF (cytidylyltransferase family)/aryl-alcohol dehydrogenase-like predicted oxidoreductase
MTDTLVLIQSRMNSRRLPGKALLPIGGMPAAVLCAKRAGNTGLRVRVATSDQASDNDLAVALESHGVDVVRGPLDNVLERFRISFLDMHDSDVLVRLTADNMFPDGAFVEEAVRLFRESGLDYTCTMHPALDKLPYGLVAEVCTAGFLREAAANARSDYEREHVTVWMTNNKNRAGFTIVPVDKDYMRLRATMDTRADYERISACFTDGDAVSVPWQVLCERLAKYESRKHIPSAYASDGRVVSALSLGTAQLGLVYGVNNQTGMPDDSAFTKIMDYALEHDIATIDTAPAYGIAEERIGRYFKDRDKNTTTIATKLPHAVDNVGDSIQHSCDQLDVDILDCVLLHDWRDYTKSSGALWRDLIDLKAQGKIKALGASVETPEQALAALDDEDIKFLQIPFNILDHRWRSAGVPEKARARRDVIVQARSVFLQGLLLCVPESLPVKNFDFTGLYSKIDDLVARFGRQGREDLCLAYGRGQTWIHTLVLGSETPEQVAENIRLYKAPALDDNQCRIIEETFPDAPDRLLNPSLWEL